MARASLEELLEDYRDYLRSAAANSGTRTPVKPSTSASSATQGQPLLRDFREGIETRPAEIVANILICLIHQANYLLDQQLRRLEQDFLKEGGLRERMTRARLAARSRQRP